MKTLRSLVLGAASVVVAGCGSRVPDPQAIQKRLELQSFQSCEELEKYVEDTAVLQMRMQLEQSKKTYSSGGGILTREGAPAADTNMTAAPAASSGPSAYTTTNTQVAGVDEADFVKNDGTRIFVLSGDTLYINQSWPAAELKTVSKVRIHGWPREMFLDDKNHVVVFSSIWSPYPFDRRLGDVYCLSLDCGYYSANTVKVTVIDVANLAAPVVQQEYYLPGYYSSSRRIGSSVRVVLSDDFRWPEGLQWWPTYTDAGLYQDASRFAAAVDELIAQNEKIIRAASLHDWLPTGVRKLEDGSEIELGYACSDFSRSNAPTRLGLLTVATLNLDTPGEMTRTSVVAEAGELYASQKHLYVANRHWWWWPEPGQADYTYLHKFDITDPDRAVHVASGGVDGHIVDQFSMDENAAGYFRVATTIATRIEDSNQWWGRIETTNRVSVLGEQSGALEVIGQTPDLAKGERITSSRFFEDKGFVVTFRQVDPLFTLDLKEPTNPRVVAELKVPGFSTYLHPLDADHLLTIGTYIDPANTWQSRSLQLAIYDVADLANPKQTFTQNVGTAYGWSEAQSEHKAFNYFPARKLLAIPFHDYLVNQTDYWTSFVSDLRVFGVDAATGFTPKGALSMKDVYVTYNDYGWSYYWAPWVRRSVMADQFVYAISDAGIRVADVANLSQPLGTVTFQKAVQGGTAAK
jgi:uncharacterized secreted protein with C-terminal beta-propeller domain